MYTNKVNLNQMPLRNWVMDESSLSEADKAILDKVKFPKLVKANEMLQRVVGKFGGIGQFSPKQQLTVNESISDVVYKKVSDKVARHQINQHAASQEVAIAYSQGNISHATQVVKGILHRQGYDATKQNIEYQMSYCLDATKPKPRMHFYIDASFVQQEMEDLLAKYSTPKPTPSQQKAIESGKEETVNAVVEDPKVKGLGNVDKKKARELYEKGASASEIAKELGRDEQRIINYLKTLS